MFISLGYTGINIDHFWEWEGPCGVCGKLNKFINAVFCSNFPFKRGFSPPCYNSWCAKCYIASDKVKFHINLEEDDDGIGVADVC